MGHESELLEMTDDDDDDNAMLVKGLMERNQQLKKKILRIRGRTVDPTKVPEINTRDINDGLRTPLMIAVDQVLKSLPSTPYIQPNKLTREYIGHMRFLLQVFPPMYTNVYIQDRDSKDLLRRLTDLLKYKVFFDVPTVDMIRDYINVSTINHVPLTRDVTIAPMMGTVPCDGSRFSAVDDEIKIWVSGARTCCVPKNYFLRDEINRSSYPLYLAIDDRFCTLLRDRDGIPADESIRLLLPNWWDNASDHYEHRHVLFGAKKIPEAPSLMYQLIQL